MKSQVSTLSKSFFASVSASRFLQAIITFYAHHQIKNLILLSIILSRWSFLPRGRCYFFLAIFIKQLAKDVDFERAGLAAFYGPLCLFLYRQRELRQRHHLSEKGMLACSAPRENKHNRRDQVFRSQTGRNQCRARKYHGRRLQ